MATYVATNAQNSPTRVRATADRAGESLVCGSGRRWCGDGVERGASRCRRRAWVRTIQPPVPGQPLRRQAGASDCCSSQRVRVCDNDGEWLGAVDPPPPSDFSLSVRSDRFIKDDIRYALPASATMLQRSGSGISLRASTWLATASSHPVKRFAPRPPHRPPPRPRRRRRRAATTVGWGITLDKINGPSATPLDASKARLQTRARTTTRTWRCIVRQVLDGTNTEQHRRLSDRLHHDGPQTHVGKQVHPGRYVQSGTISMATYVATKSPGFADPNPPGNPVLAVRANLSQSVGTRNPDHRVDGVAPTFASALGQHRFAVGGGTDADGRGSRAQSR